MEKLKTARKPIRALVTKTCNEINELIRADEFDEIQAVSKANKLDDLLQKIRDYDQQILDLFLEADNEQGYEDEVLVIDKYNDEVIIAKARIEKELRRTNKQDRDRESSEYSTVQSVGGRSKRKFKLPKIELMKFSGKLIDWLSWWSQFEKIHNDDELHTTDKFEYLRQAMDTNTRAKEIVDGYPATVENYPKVIKALTERFGKKKLLTQVYVRELFQMGLKNLNKEVEISSIFDKLVSHVRALESLGVTIEQAALFLYPMVESSLPEDVLVAWQRSPLYEKDGSMENPLKNELDYLFQFLQQEVERAEQRQLVKASFSSKESSNQVSKKKEIKKEKGTPTAAGLFNGQSKPVSCIFCDKPHESKDCATTEFWSLEEIKKKIQEKRACFYCLKQNHSARTCKSFVKCHVCSKRHFTVTCPEIKEKKNQTKEGTNSSAGSNFDCSNEVLMKTIMVYVSINSKKKLARLLFDDGSQRSYITSSVAKAIKSKPFDHEYVRNILFDGTITNQQKFNNHKVNIMDLVGANPLPVIVRERSVIGGKISRIPKGHWLDEFHAKQIQFTDVNSGTDCSAEIDIVIGSDYWGLAMTGRKESLPYGLTAFESIWGWTLSGIVPNVSKVDNFISMFLAEEEVKKLWSLDVIGIKDPIEKLTEIQEEIAAKKTFKDGLKRKSDGRYVVKLPWVNEIPSIANNKKTALSRLIAATKKLKLNKQMKTYDEVFKSWLDEGIIEKVSDNENGHFLPHRPVFKDSITTPVRPVFDASCKTQNNYSLNDCLYKGSNYIESLPTMLMRFRMHTVGVLSDIRKAFLMIEVEEGDREYLKFLWWEDETQNKTIVFRHSRVVFGLKSSPFLLAAVLDEHLSNVNEPLKKTAEELKKSLYIDNCVTSLESLKEYEQFKKESVEILAEAKFELRQWEYSLPYNPDEVFVPAETKVLGLVWEKKQDTLRIQTPTLEKKDKLTKREIASVLHQFFDPLGFIAPALIKPKIMLQQAWKKNATWDSELPAIWRDQFNKWCSEAIILNNIKLPRLCRIPKSINHQLHTFADASQDAYATVVFLRSEYEGNVTVQLIQCKSRVAPISKSTIPRLELLSCLIGSRLAKHSMEAMNLQNVESYYWSDSTTAIAWIQRNSQWGTFVNNRAKRIREITDANQWRHVPGSLNPADLPSRGCSPMELLQSNWWEGPSWLRSTSDKWPNNKLEVDEEVVNSEIKRKSTTTMFSIEEKGWFNTKFSGFSTKLRIMAWLLRFCHNCRNPQFRQSEKYLSIPELRDAEIAIIRIIQQEAELGAKEEKQIKKCMAPSIMHDKGLIRLKTPITRRMDTVGFRFPYLLPSKHPMVRDLIWEVHKNYCHAGAQFIMTKLREKYWITQARKTISSVIHHCVTCQRFVSKGMDVVPAALPETRVRSGEIFDSTGVDLFGPITLRNGSKVWVVLYTCAVYRAVHLDVVKSTSTSAFIESLKMFIYQYGRPLDMLSDNGTNFTGTANLFRAINKEELRERCQTEKIRWNFNPPSAPWWGGFFERMVRSVKEPLRKVLGQSSINQKQLELLLAEIKSVINDRPLTSLTEDPEDLEPLTPNMFLRGTKNASFPEEEEITGSKLRKEWQRIQDYKTHLQSRFRKEYLGQLVEHKRINKSSTINIGDIVLVENDKKKRYQWPMGRVLEIIPSPDGEIRIAKIKTKTGCINRPLRRLFPLEMSQSSPRPIISDKHMSIPSNEKNEDFTPTIEELDESKGKTTRSGRKVKKPFRYTSWNN